MDKQNTIANLYDSAVKAKTTLIREVIGRVTQRRVGRKELAMASMYKTKGTSLSVKPLPTLADGLMPSGGVLSSTSKTLSASSGESITNLSNGQILDGKSEKKYEKAVPSAALRAVSAQVDARAPAPVAQHRWQQGLS
jgi:hypothetical protein